MKGTIRELDSGASALVPFSMVSDGSAARTVHEADYMSDTGASIPIHFHVKLKNLIL
jgi:hypothetical protein